MAPGYVIFIIFYKCVCALFVFVLCVLFFVELAETSRGVDKQRTCKKLTKNETMCFPCFSAKNSFPVCLKVFCKLYGPRGTS